METQVILLVCYTLLSMTSSNDNFLAVQSSNGANLCAAALRSTVVTSSKSQIDCVRKCKCHGQACLGANHVTGRCEMFFCPPTNFSLQTGCRYFSAPYKENYSSLLPAENCSFPFTYNGGLYYSCIESMAGITDGCFAPFGCLRDNRTESKCYVSPMAGFFVAENTTQDIANASQSGAVVLVRSVFGWIVFLARNSYPGGNWHLPWTSYRNGFGTVDVNFWLGLETIYQLTSGSVKYKLRVEMLYAGDGMWYSAEYWTFSVNNEMDKYRLNIGGYSGDAGDAMIDVVGNTVQNGMRFTTKDNENDNQLPYNCATAYKGGWWFNACSYACLTCSYPSFVWLALPPVNETTYPNTVARMMMKPQ